MFLLLKNSAEFLSQFNCGSSTTCQTPQYSWRRNKINLQYVHPEARRTVQVPGTLRAERFFVECYGALGIEQKL